MVSSQADEIWALPGSTVGSIGVIAQIPNVTGLLGNEVQVMFVTLSSSINFVKQGRLKLFGVVAPKRLPVLPDTPTLAESGVNAALVAPQLAFDARSFRDLVRQRRPVPHHAANHCHRDPDAQDQRDARKHNDGCRRF